MSDVRIKIARLQENLSRRFLEREHVIDGCLAAILTGEHVLLIGTPGTAKSALARSIAQAFGGSYFEWLLTKHSKPDELFGPISLRALEQDRFERSIEGKLPTVEFAFTDEIFKSSSTILNSLLTLMNERLFHNGGDPLKCPLVTLFGASNELPQGGDLEALYDRFLLRYEVKSLSKRESRLSVYTSPNPEPEQLLTMDDLRQAQEEVKKVQLSDDTIDGLLTVQEALRTNGIELSDRRWKKCYSLVKVSAYLAGNDETCPDDIRSITDALWREPKERDRVAQLVLENAEKSSKKRRFKVMSMAGEWVSLEEARLAVEAFFKKSKVPPLAGQRAWVREVTSRGGLVSQTLLSVDPFGNAAVVDAAPFGSEPAAGSEHFRTLLSVARKIDAGILTQGMAELKVVLEIIDLSIEQAAASRT